ncbi:MAG: RuBisCO large subunit C-terminal-like domain-containing protein [Roseiflexaceae bacterium]
MDASAQMLWHDADARDVYLRELITDRLAKNPPPAIADAIVATYFFAFRTQRLEQAGEEIAYHATSGVRHPPAGSLLEACTATAVGVEPLDNSGQAGLVHIAFPLKMMLQPDGHLTSSDLLHTIASAIIFDFYENQDAQLIDMQIPDQVLGTFPGPAHGPRGIRQLTGFAPDQPAFGTILKPTAGITPDVVETLVADAARCPLFMFIKEDEDLYPNLSYAPVRERTRRAIAAIERARDARGGLGLVFAPHISGAPHEILATVDAVLEAGATGVMFSETFAGGAVRMVREATKHLPVPPVIYGHNAGISVKTRAIRRELIDLLARLDGIDLRQTAPVGPTTPMIRPYGAEWLASEQALSRSIPGIKPTMIARAGGLDQGNIILNLLDGERRGITENLLFLAGSAINSIKDADGKADPRRGAAAMTEAVQVYQSGELRDVPPEEHVRTLAALAAAQGCGALQTALRQRYPHIVN